MKSRASFFAAALPAFVSAALFCASCSDATGTPAAPIDQVTPEDVDGGEDDPPCAPPKITFQKSPVEITPTRDHHVTLVHQIDGVPYLYVLGGEQDDFAVILGDVQRARIQPDGTLGAFEEAGTIPKGRAGAALGVVGDDVVLAGGVIGPRTGFTDEIIVARFDAEGRLDNWRAGPTLPKSVQHAAAVVVERDVYVFGGTTGSAATKISVKTTVQDDGTLAPLTSLTALDGPRSHHAAFTSRGFIYLAGGLDKGPIGNPASLSSVVRASVQPDGTLSAWEPAGELSSRLSVSAAQIVGCSVLFPGGLDDGVKAGPYSDGILRASIGSDGAFRAEAALEEKLSVKRGHVHQTPVYEKLIFSVGGRANDFSTLGTVEIGTIEP